MKILVVAAHPDDEILGCGGTIARMVSEGDTASAIIFSPGVTSRPGATPQGMNTLEKESVSACNLIGYENVVRYNYPDNKFDTIEILKTIQAIEIEIDESKPDVIFTHWRHDLNIDHQRVAQAVLTATRPPTCVNEIYAFETASSTEWNFSESFKPNVFFDITNTLDTKCAALKEYKSEMREFPHPRSEFNIRNLARVRGAQSGFEAAEAFELVRAFK